MKSLNGVAVVAAWGVLALAGPASARGDWQWIPIADSEADFSGVQGQGGWYYLFATSEEDPGGPMPVFNPQCVPLAGVPWLTTPWTPGCGTFCTLDSRVTCTSAPASCSSAGSGLQIPIRRFAIPSAGQYRLVLTVIDDDNLGGNQDGVRVTLVAGAKLLWETESDGQVPFAEEVVVDTLLTSDTPVDVRSHPKSGCHTDWHQVYLVVSALDCNGDGIVDYGQILDGTFEDTNANGVPDCCDEGVSCDSCIGDVNFDGTVNGADISVLLGFWGLNGRPVAADINKDGQVDGADLAQMLGSWGECQ